MNYATDISYRFEELGAEPKEGLACASEQLRIDESNEEGQKVDYIGYADATEDFASERADTHMMMGENEALRNKDFNYFKGICLDTGAQRSAAGPKQCKTYLDERKAPKLAIKPIDRVG